MTKLDRSMLQKRINLMMKYLDRLHRMKNTTLDDYNSDFDQQLIVERLLQLLVEAASDINTSLLTEMYGITPSTYFDSFIEAGEQNIIAPQLAKEIAQSAGLRNRLVHQYEEIDNVIVFRSIQFALDQFSTYLRQITNYLDTVQ
ncbi:MAG: type VII toxin-antitoxin system HepT family RNase toxin [Prochlorotrichaceae cyanobacterium]|jgi:uncharacterized protein YutE (UPF0331/DUF86 family)